MEIWETSRKLKYFLYLANEMYVKSEMVGLFDDQCGCIAHIKSICVSTYVTILW